MKLLVTGGSGFLGRRTAAYFAELGHRVLAPAHRELDITDVQSVEDWFGRNMPEAVIHTAAISDTGLCQREPEWSETVNVTGCANLAKACRKYGAKLVICSSDQVYAGSTIPGPHGEAEPVAPTNVYGRQKLQAEQRCLEILPETVCLRLSWLYARESLPGEHSHFLAALKAAMEDETLPLTWPVYDRRGITDTRYVVENLPEVLGLPGGVWNYGSENNDSTYETVRSLLEELGMEAVLRRLTPNREAFAENPRDISMNTKKLKAAGISFPTTKEGLLRALEDWKEEK